MTAPYKIVLFDDCCDVYTSTDTGETWTTNKTPAGTLGDDWTDMYMAVVDGDYSTLGLFDFAVSSTYDAARFNNSRGGVEVCEADKAATSTIQSYSRGTLGTNFQNAVSGCINRGGQTIIVAPVDTDSFGGGTSTNYPRRSTDGGATWADMTGFPAGMFWTRAVASKDMGIIYAHALDDFIYKSTDGGATSTKLSSGPGFVFQEGDLDGQTRNAMRLRCSQNGLIVAGVNQHGDFWISTDAGSTWSNTSFPSLISETADIVNADMGMSLDGSVVVVAVTQTGAGTISFLFLSTDFGATWQQITPASHGTPIANVNVTPDGVAIVITYVNGITTALVDVSVDQGITWSTKTFALPTNGSGGDPGTFVSAYILPNTQSADTTPSGDPSIRPLVGATYRRTSAFTSESPAFVGWHRHDFGHGRNQLMSIGVSSDIGGLLDHLDMVTTDGTNYFVEGFTQLFDEDDDLTDGWFLDGALVPDSAYEDTVGGVDGIRFTGLWWLRSTTVTVCAFGLDLGDFFVDLNGTVFVPYGSGTAPSSFDYTSAGAGAYLFTAAYITANLSTTDVRNGGVPYSGKFMPVVVGFTYTSDGQILRPIAAEQTGTRSGPSFGDKRRSHYVKALLHNTIGIMFGTDFGTTLQQAKLASDAGAQPTPTEMYSGLWRETLNDDYTFDSMLSWRIVRPYPASVVSIGASVEGTDA